MSTSNRYSDHHDLTLNEICVTAMIPDLDIYRSANVLIREHGEGAAWAGHFRSVQVLRQRVRTDAPDRLGGQGAR